MARPERSVSGQKSFQPFVVYNQALVLPGNQMSLGKVEQMIGYSRPLGSSRSSQAPSTIQQPHAQSAAQGSMRRTTTIELNVAKTPIGFQGSSRKCDNHHGTSTKTPFIVVMNQIAPETIRATNARIESSASVAACRGFTFL
jgi:hypothetical protein